MNRPAIGQMSKRDAKKRMQEIESKAKKLFFSNYITTKDLDAILRILDLRYKKLV
jgi:hypothetical protein